MISCVTMESRYFTEIFYSPLYPHTYIIEHNDNNIALFIDYNFNRLQFSFHSNGISRDFYLDPGWIEGRTSRKIKCAKEMLR